MFCFLYTTYILPQIRPNYNIRVVSTLIRHYQTFTIVP